jgi:hypothetical protein
MKVKNTIKKVGAAAASTLMVGMTLGSAASLADFPGLFLDDDGTPTSQIVVGSQGNVGDVVGAINVAAALGQATIQTEEKTETVSASGSPGWSATDGATLDSVNQNLYAGDDAHDVRETLTADDLDVLEGGTVTDPSGNQYDYDHYIDVGTAGNQIQYGGTSDQDPMMRTNFGTNTMYTAKTVFQDNLNTTLAAGEPIELFGKTYQLSSDTSELSSSKLTLFGGGQDTSLQVGDSTTVTVDGTDFDVTLNGITNDDKADLTINGNNYVKGSGTTLTVSDTTIFVDSVKVYTIPENTGSVQLSFGSQKTVMEDGKAVRTGSDQSKIKGTSVTMKGSGEEVSTVEVAVSQDTDDEKNLDQGESFDDPVFETFSMAFEGLNPDTTAGEGDEVEVMASGDDNAEVSFPKGGSTHSVNFAHWDSGSTSLNLADGDNNNIRVVEGASVADDEYTVLESGEFRRFVQVTDITVSEDVGGQGNNEDEATVSFEDAITGTSYEVTLETADDGTGQTGVNSLGDWDTSDKIIDGQTYTVSVEGVSAGSGGSVDSLGFTDSESGWDVYNGLETSGGAMVHMTAESSTLTIDGSGSSSTPTSAVTIHLPSGDVDVWASSVDSTSADAGESVEVDTDQDGTSDVTVAEGSAGTFTVGDVEYAVEADGDAGADDDMVDYTWLLGDSDGTTGDTSSSDLVRSPGVHVVEEENDQDNQNALFVSAAFDGNSNDDERVEVGNAFSSGNGGDTGTAAFVSIGPDYWSGLQTHDSDSDMASGVDRYGTHVIEDQSSAGTYTFHYPDNQPAAGLAFLGEGGSLSAGGSGGSASVTYNAVANDNLMGMLPDMAKTDQEVSSSDRNSQDMILVGGPAVNSLVADLAADGKTWDLDTWRNQHQDEALVQLVEDAFSQGNHAMIVAGYAEQDTRGAAKYVAEYSAHQSDLQGNNQVTLTQAMYPE